MSQICFNFLTHTHTRTHAHTCIYIINFFITLPIRSQTCAAEWVHLYCLKWTTRLKPYTSILFLLLLSLLCLCVLAFRENASSQLLVEVLLYVHRNHRLIRDGSPGRPPRLPELYIVRLVGWVLLYVHRNRRLIRDGSPGRPPRLPELYIVRLVGWVLLYVHRNRRLIRDGSPGRPPRLSHSSWALRLHRDGSSTTSPRAWGNVSADVDLSVSSPETDTLRGCLPVTARRPGSRQNLTPVILSPSPASVTFNHQIYLPLIPSDLTRDQLHASRAPTESMADWRPADTAGTHFAFTPNKWSVVFNSFTGRGGPTDTLHVRHSDPDARGREKSGGGDSLTLHDAYRIVLWSPPPLPTHTRTVNEITCVFPFVLNLTSITTKY